MSGFFVCILHFNLDHVLEIFQNDTFIVTNLNFTIAVHETPHIGGTLENLTNYYYLLFYLFIIVTCNVQYTNEGTSKYNIAQS